MKNLQRSALQGALVASICVAAPTMASSEDNSSSSRPVLAEFVQTATMDHPLLANAQAQLDKARARARGQNRPLYNPELELEYEDADEKTKTVGIAQSIDWSGKRRARYSVAQAEVDLAGAAFEITRKALLTELLVGLSNSQFSLKEHQLSERRVELGQEFLALAERRNRAGDITKAELLTARLALAEAQAAMNTAQNELSRAQEQLAGISGGNRALWPALQGVPTEAQPSLESIHPVELPELRFATMQTQVSRTQIRLAQKDRNPDPTLGVRYGEEGTSTLVGVSFSIPIPILNNYRAEVDEAQAGLIGAEQSYLDVQRRISARLQSSHERYLRSYENWLQWQSEGEQLLLEQRQLLQKLWQLGEINAVDYLVQLNQTFATESASSQLHSRLWNDWFLWLDASGSTSEWTENLQ